MSANSSWLTMGRKFGLIGLLVAVLFGLPFFLYEKDLTKGVATAELERRGIKTYPAVIKLLQSLQKHRGLNAGALSGNFAMVSQRNAMTQEVHHAVKDLTELAKQHEVLKLEASLGNLRQQWGSLSEECDRLTPKDSFARHTALTAAVIEFGVLVADNSGLTLDPEAASYYLMDGAVMKLPALTEDLGKARALGTASLTKKSVSTEEKVKLTALHSSAVDGLRTALLSLQKAMAEESKVKASLNSQIENTKPQVSEGLALLMSRIIEPAVLEFDPKTYFQTMSTAIDASFELGNASLKQLDGLLEERVSALASKRNTIIWTCLSLFILVVLFAWGVVRSVIRDVGMEPHAAAAIAHCIASGDLSAEIPIRKGDTTSIAANIQQVVESLRALIADADRLSTAALGGQLSIRAEAQRHQGDYRKIVQGFNETLDAVIGPLNVAAGYVDNISRGVIPAKISDPYEGDFNILKSNLNQCIDGLQGLVEANQVLQRMAANDLTSQVKGDYQGIFAEVAQAINVTIANQSLVLREVQNGALTMAGSAEELTATSSNMAGHAEEMTKQAATAAQGTEQSASNVKNMAAGIEEISANSNSVASATEEVTANLRTVGAAVEQMSSSMKNISNTTEEVTGSVSTVARAIEEMSASLHEVSKNSSQAAAVASKAAHSANSTATTVAKLGQSAQEIGKVVELIKGIAAQTNLLALNATIEAASAGDAGKGFAVVANEVKELAKQTAGATEEIRAQVAGMQANTGQAVRAIDEIVQIINEINTISATIAASVEEQTATTQEISRNVGVVARGAKALSSNVSQAAAGANEVSRNVQEAVKGATEIARNIGQLALGSGDVARHAGEAAQAMNKVAQNVSQVSSSALDTTRGAADTNTASRELSRLAEKLQSAVTRFKL